MNTTADPTPSWPAFARQVIEQALGKGESGATRPPAPGTESYGGVFVTLRKSRRLRGCMGTLDASQAVTEAVRHAARSAALRDPRFPPVTLAELAELTIEVSILSEAWPMRDLDELQLGRHGILVRQGLNQGLFLPQVATEHRLDKETFLSRCCSEKAGLPADAWRNPDIEVLLFTAQVFSESAGEAAD